MKDKAKLKLTYNDLLDKHEAYEYVWGIVSCALIVLPIGVSICFIASRRPLLATRCVEVQTTRLLVMEFPVTEGFCPTQDSTAVIQPVPMPVRPCDILPRPVSASRPPCVRGCPSVCS